MLSNTVKYQKAKHVILKFILDPDNINWGQEIKIAYQLFKIVPEYKFWTEKLVLKDKIHSLAWFLTDYGKKYTNRQKEIWNDASKIDFSVKKPKYELEWDKVGNDKTIKKDKNIIDFVN